MALGEKSKDLDEELDDSPIQEEHHLEGIVNPAFSTGEVENEAPESISGFEGQASPTNLPDTNDSDGVENATASGSNNGIHFHQGFPVPTIVIEDVDKDTQNEVNYTVNADNENHNKKDKLIEPEQCDSEHDSSEDKSSVNGEIGHSSKGSRKQSVVTFQIDNEDNGITGSIEEEEPSVYRGRSRGQNLLFPPNEVHVSVSEDEETPAGTPRRFSFLNTIKKSFSPKVTGKKNSSDPALEIFTELLELKNTYNDKQWKERARWIKYEENFEENTGRWGKPHVASLSFSSLNQLQCLLAEGLILLDTEDATLQSLAKTISEHLVKNDQIYSKDATLLQETILCNTVHAFGTSAKRRGYTKGSSMAACFKQMCLDISSNCNSKNEKEDDNANYKSEANIAAHNDIMDKLSENAEAFTVMVGKVDFLVQPICIFVRLDEERQWDGMVEVPIPVRYIFYCLGPQEEGLDYYEVGRSMATVMSTFDFQHTVSEAMTKRKIVSGLSNFVQNSLVLPPGDWQEETLLPIIAMAKNKATEVRKKSLHPTAMRGILEQLQINHFGDPLQRTGRAFGGMVNDIKKRYPKYLSDIKDGFNPQCIATFFYMYFSCLATVIAYGGLMSKKTNHWMGVSELLVGTSVCGIVFSLLSAQPLKVTAISGSILLLEESLYNICESLDIEYISMRVWMMLWMALIFIVIVAVDGSMLVRYVTRFTVEIFSALISILFIYETFYKLYKVFQYHPIQSTYPGCLTSDMYPGYNSSESHKAGYPVKDFNYSYVNSSYDPYGHSDHASSYEAEKYHSKEKILNQPNTALLSMIFTLGTFSIAYYLGYIFRNSKNLGATARGLLGDFRILVALVTMALIDWSIKDVYTEKLDIPDGLVPTASEKRGWLINPMGMSKPFPIWAIFFAIIPAFLGFILIFVETQVTEVILNKKQFKLKKGSGFHWDILLIGLLQIINGFLGMPLLTGANVKTISHLNALSVNSKTHAPGEHPHLVKVIEQRTTNLAVHIMIGISVFLKPLLKYIPISVAYGIFLYSGVSSMHGVQFFERFHLFFVPVKHHPNEPFVSKVHTWKMHLWTFIQILCLGILWAITASPAVLAFPLVVLLTIPLRKFLLPWIFSGREIHFLDQDGNSEEYDEDVGRDLDKQIEKRYKRMRLSAASIKKRSETPSEIDV